MRRQRDVVARHMVVMAPLVVLRRPCSLRDGGCDVRHGPMVRPRVMVVERARRGGTRIHGGGHDGVACYSGEVLAGRFWLW
jgi:hypothetical protein